MHQGHAEAITAAEALVARDAGLESTTTRERRPDVFFRCGVTYRVLQREPHTRELVRSFGFPSSD